MRINGYQNRTFIVHTYCMLLGYLNSAYPGNPLAGLIETSGSCPQKLVNVYRLSAPREIVSPVSFSLVTTDEGS